MALKNRQGIIGAFAFREWTARKQASDEQEAQAQREALEQARERRLLAELGELVGAERVRLETAVARLAQAEERARTAADPFRCLVANLAMVGQAVARRAWKAREEEQARERRERDGARARWLIRLRKAVEAGHISGGFIEE